MSAETVATESEVEAVRLALAHAPRASYTDVQRATGLPMRAVRAACGQLGHERKRGPVAGTVSPLASYAREELQAALDARTSVAAFAKARGVSRASVYAAVKRWGLRAPWAP